MRNAEEERIYRLLERLDQEEGGRLAEKVPAAAYPEESIPPEIMARLKRRTWEKLGMERTKQDETEISVEPLQAVKTSLEPEALSTARRPQLSKSRKGLIAVSAALLVFAAAVGSSEDVRADIKKALRFIPGFGYVKEEDRAQKTFVLQKPAVKQVEDGELRIDAILAEQSRTIVQISGKGRVDAPSDFMLLTGDGTKYPFKRSMLASGGEWQGLYYHEGTIVLTAETEITLKLGRTDIGPLHLIEPRTGEELQDFGRAAAANGIKVAAVVTPLSGSRMKVNLLSQLPQGMKLDSYGLQPINPGIRAVLSDETTGKAIDIPQDSGFVKAAEFDFEDTSQGKSRYTLSIPYLRVVDTEAPFQKVTLPVPSEGSSADLNVTVTLAGFPESLYRIERADAKTVRVYADVHYNAEAPATLHDFRVDMKDPGRQSYSWKVKDDTRAMDAMQLDILPEMKQLTFYVGEPWILLKGPWNIDLGQMSVSR